MKTIKGFIIISTLFILHGCSIKKYYFQIPKFTKTKIYKYECKEEPNKTEYWKLTSNINSKTLITEAFNNNKRQYEYFKEKITKNGSELVEFISYQYDSNGKKINTTQHPIKIDVYKWDTKNSYKYAVESIEKGFGKIIFEKERYFIGKEKIQILGKKYKAIKFRGIYKTEVPKTKQTYIYKQFSYYIKGIGLAKMEKEYSDGKKVTLELTEIISAEKWETMLKIIK